MTTATKRSETGSRKKILCSKRASQSCTSASGSVFSATAHRRSGPPTGLRVGAVAIGAEIVFRRDAVEAAEEKQQLVSLSGDEQRCGNRLVLWNGNASIGLRESEVLVELDDRESRGGDLRRIALLADVVSRDENDAVEAGDEQTRRDGEIGGLDGDAGGASVDVEIDELLLLPHEEDRFGFLARDEEIAHVAGRREVLVQQHRRVEVHEHRDQVERVVAVDHIVRIASRHHQRRHAAQNARREADRLAADLHLIDLLRLRVAVQRDQQQIAAVRADIQQRVVRRRVLLVVGAAHVRERVDAAGVAVHRDGIARLQHVPDDLKPPNRAVADREEEVVSVLQHVVDLRVHHLRFELHDAELGGLVVHQLQAADVVRDHHGDVVRPDEAAPDLVVAAALPLRHAGHVLQKAHLRGRDLHIHAVVHAGVQRLLERGEVGRLDHLEVGVARDRHHVGAAGGRVGAVAGREDRQRVHRVVLQGGERVQPVIHAVRVEIDRRQHLLDGALNAQRDGAEPSRRAVARGGDEAIHRVREGDQLGDAGQRGENRSGLQSLQLALDDVVDGEADATVQQRARRDLSPFSQNSTRCVSVAHIAE